MKTLTIYVFLQLAIISVQVRAVVKFKTHGYKENVILEIAGEKFVEYRDYDRKTKTLKELRIKSDKIELQRLYNKGVEYRQIVTLYTENSIKRLVFQSFDETKPLKLVLYKKEPYRIWYLPCNLTNHQQEYIKKLADFLSERSEDCSSIHNEISKFNYDNISDCIDEKKKTFKIDDQLIINSLISIKGSSILTCHANEKSSADIKNGKININPKDKFDAALLEEIVHLSGVGFHTCSICATDKECSEETEEDVKNIREVFRECASAVIKKKPSSMKIESANAKPSNSTEEELEKRIVYLNEKSKSDVIPRYIRQILSSKQSEIFQNQFMKIDFQKDNECLSYTNKLLQIHKEFCKSSSDCLTKEDVCSNMAAVEKYYSEACSDVGARPLLPNKDIKNGETIVSSTANQAVVNTAPGETKSGVYTESRSGFNFPTPKSLESFKGNFAQVVSGLGGSNSASSKSETVLMKSSDAGSILSSNPTYSYSKGNGALDIQFSKNPNLLASNTTGLPAGLDSSRFNGSASGSSAEKMGAAQIQSKGGASPAPKSGGSVGSSASGATDVGDVQFGGSGAGVRMPAAAQAQAQAKTRSSALENRAAKKNFNLDELKNKASVDDCKSYAQSLADNVSIRCGGKPAREEKPGSSYYNFEVVNGIRKVQKWDPMSKKWKDTP